MKFITGYCGPTVILLLAMNAYALSTQAQPLASISPIPPIMPGAVIPDDSPQFVYLGPNTFKQITISYPAGLTTGSMAGPRRTFQVDLLNQVEPTVISTVTTNADGTFDYAYRAEDSAKAAKPIKVWAIGIPSAQAVVQASHASWRASQEAPAGQAPAPPGAYSMTPVALLTWREPSGGAVTQGAAITGFHIQSVYLPGFTTAYARSDETFAVPSDLPAAVKDQLAPLYRPEWMNRSVLAIGPRYPQNWSKLAIAVDFQHGIQRLSAEGRLSQASLFVSGALTALQAFIGTQGGSSGVSLDFLDIANTPLETEIAAAMRISLK